MMDPPRPAATAWRQKTCAAEPFSAQIHVHHIAPLLIGQLHKRNDGFNARVVHQHVDRPQLFLYPIEHGLHLGALSDVCLDYQRTPALAPDPFRNRASFLARSEVIDGDVSTFHREYFGNAFADSLAGSGNERYFIAELHIHPVPLASVDRPATVNHQHVSDHHIGKRAGEKQYRAHQVLGLIPSSAWNHFLGGPFFVARSFQDIFA